MAAATRCGRRTSVESSAGCATPRWVTSTAMGRRRLRSRPTTRASVAVVRPDDSGGFSVAELDAAPNTIVHEIELGDLDGDGTLEIYATPTAPNEVDGTPQAGRVVRYVPANGEGPVEVAGSWHPSRKRDPGR